MDFTILSGYILKGYIITYIISLILSSDPQNLKYLLSSTFRSLLLSTLEPQKIEGAKLD